MSEHPGTQKHQDMAGALFIIDLARCTGCHACAMACKDRGASGVLGRDASLLDDVDMLWVRSEERGQYAQPDGEPLEVIFRPVHCWHCQDADIAANGCAAVCPVEAIRADGGRWPQRGHWRIDLDTCVRCGACAEVCPFEAIDQLADGTPVVCDGCVDELARGWEPTCVRACPMRALAYRPYDGAGYSAAVPSATVPSAEEYAGREPDTAWDAHDLRPRVVYLKRRKGSQ